MKITIDESAGFCKGVLGTLDKVEQWLSRLGGENVYVLGEIIHNPREIERLERLGLNTVYKEDLPTIAPLTPKLIIRAHGEPPSTYELADRLGLDVIDATCPLVKDLQEKIRSGYEGGWQIVIYGKREHAEVVGLRGVCNDDCVVVRSPKEALDKVDLSRKTMLFSQTTMDRRTFAEIKKALKEKAKKLLPEDSESCFTAKNTICKYVSGRENKLKEFAKANNAVIFLSGKNSSNGRSLFNVCVGENPNSFFVESFEEIQLDQIRTAEKVGISGATSAPQWYMQLIKEKLELEFGAD